MTHTFRAFLAVLLLGGFYVLVAGVFAVIAAVGFVLFVLIDVSPLLFLPYLLIPVYLVYTLGGAVLSSLRVERDEDNGVLVTPESQPEIWARVREFADAVGTRPPDEIRLVGSVNAMVSEETRLLGLVGGTRRLYIGVPLMLALTRSQLYAVLCHELGHYSGRHTALGVISYRGRKAVSRAAYELGHETVTGQIFTSYARLFLRVSQGVSRRQEIEADAVAARVAGRDIAAAALRELEPIAAAWEAFLAQYVWPAQRVGLRPEAFAEGFLDFLDDPVRRTQLTEIRDHPDLEPSSPYDSHPTIPQRVALLAALEPDGRVDDRLPGFAVLTDPDATMNDFFTPDERGAALEAADWERIGTAVGNRRAQSQAALLVGALERMPHRRDRPVTLVEVASELRSGRGPELASRVSTARSSFATQAVARHLVASLIGATLVAHGRATYRLDWSGQRPHLTDPEGRVVEVGPVGERALESRTGVRDLLDLAESYGVPTEEVLAFPEPDPDPEGLPVALACLAPLQMGLGTVTLILCTHGLAVFRIRGIRERLAASLAKNHAGEKLAASVLRVPLEKALERRGAELVGWDEIASVTVDRPRHGPVRLVVTTLVGDVRRLKMDDAEAEGDPAAVLTHYLGARFVEPARR